VTQKPRVSRVGSGTAYVNIAAMAPTVAIIVRTTVESLSARVKARSAIARFGIAQGYHGPLDEHKSFERGSATHTALPEFDLLDRPSLA